MRRVSLILRNFEPGGVERVTAQLARGFSSIGWSSEVVLLEPEGLPLARKWLQSVPIVALPALQGVSGARRLWSQIAALRLHLKDVRPELMISAKEYANIALAAAASMAAVPGCVVATRHVPLHRIAGNTDVRWYTRSIYKGLQVRCDRFVAVSDEIAQQLREILPGRREDISSIKNPVLDENVLLAAGAVDTGGGWPDDGAQRLVAIGRLSRQKGFDVLIRAVAALNRRRTAHLLILGEGEDREALRSLAVELGVAHRVTLMGQTDNPFRFLKAADLFVLSSRWEGLPTVLIEALALGKKVVATRCVSGPEEILGAQYRYLVPVEDSGALEQAIGAALDDPQAPTVDVAPYYVEHAARRYAALAERPRAHGR